MNDHDTENQDWEAPESSGEDFRDDWQSPEVVRRSCQLCGGELEADSSARRRFCSNACRQKHYRNEVRHTQKAKPDESWQARKEATDIAIAAGFADPWKDPSRAFRGLEEKADALDAIIREHAGEDAGNALSLAGVYHHAAELLRRVSGAESRTVQPLRGSITCIIPQDQFGEEILLCSLPVNSSPDHEEWGETWTDDSTGTVEGEAQTW